MTSTHELRIQTGKVWLDALHASPAQPRGLILCALPHIAQLRDSRDSHAAGFLHEAGFTTLLVSLLTPYEAQHDSDAHYDIALLDQRIAALLEWIAHQPSLQGLPLGVLASDSVLSACIRQFAREPGNVSALVSRAGRPELAGAAPLRSLQVPLMMIVPEAASELTAPSQQAWKLLGGEKLWHTVPGASASLIEPGSLENASRAACAWFLRHMPAAER
ncbi:alpha/beta hydrolase [Uliginosibacterium sp. TH139]|uniref:alpha/beta hydrolase n=1 Tax=Uliginosibacterium sp. TH139 TaxID=2067453 RepID=UPI000C7B8B97|nr:alpha/beta hydrolase [Uliginosibacterium sp. TH139]PLK47274.1 alpha/beta hydrolase [Uliginosibacterium sp. TH139]